MPAQSAFGAPGIPGRWTSSSKDGVGTAYSASSRVWYTISHGILNEVYYPSIDSPQIRDLQLLITDGETFFHEERRDLPARTEALDHNSLGFRITSADPEGRYALQKEIAADPHQSCVLLHVRLQAAPEWEGKLQVYVLLAPHLEGGGAGNSARVATVAGRHALVAWKNRTHLALGADRSFLRCSCGFVGASDGWQDLRDNYRLDWEFDRVEDGNIAVIGQIDLEGRTEFTLGLAFGHSLHAAATTLTQALAVPYPAHRERFLEQWRRVCCRIEELDGSSGDQGRLYRVSHKLLLAHEDKTFAGAFIASASIPWGEVQGDDDIGGYHLVWTRDLVQTAGALLACGDLVTPRRALVYLACSQRPDGGFPQNFWLDGSAYWNGLQLDEVAYPVLLAWQLWQLGALEDFDPYPTVLSAAAFLVRESPGTEQERWEENSGYSPSTLAVTISALVCAADFARARGDGPAAAFLEDHADFLESHLEPWTVTTSGTLLPGVPRHYLRIHPVDCSDPSPNEDPNCGLLEIRNQPPGRPRHYPARDVVDAGFLELVRYGLRPPGDPLVEDSLRVVDAILKVDTPAGPCWRRYNHDGYGQRPDGGPFRGWGQGRAWPLLTGERGHYELAAGRDARPHLLALERFASGAGMLPEQIWDEPDRPRRRLFLGRPTGSAMPLMWAHAEYIKLLRSLRDGQVFDRLPVVADRYLSARGRRDLEVWKHARQVSQIAPGTTLRLLCRAPFRLRWSADDWQTSQDLESTSVLAGVASADLPTSAAQRTPLCFTFFWPETGQWEDRDYQVCMAG